MVSATVTSESQSGAMTARLHSAAEVDAVNRALVRASHPNGIDGILHDMLSDDKQTVEAAFATHSRLSDQLGERYVWMAIDVGYLEVLVESMRKRGTLHVSPAREREHAAHGAGE